MTVDLPLLALSIVIAIGLSICLSLLRIPYLFGVAILAVVMFVMSGHFLVLGN